MNEPKQPELTEQQKVALAQAAGVEMDYKYDHITGKMTISTKHPVGFIWNGSKWIIGVKPS